MTDFINSFRNTPTCVGKTRINPVYRITLKKHPHLRGEDHTGGQNTGGNLETPPPAWGRLRDDELVIFSGGNTPTCVGKTHLRWQHPHLPWKHPHLRGEDVARLIHHERCQETPPPAWGRPYKSAYVAYFVRNTPTCVGKTDKPYTCARTCRKHPHLRGEDKEITKCKDFFEETPPPAWGRLDEHGQPTSWGRNTPTCVGKTNKVGMST